jgi:predicted RNA methylase
VSAEQTPESLVSTKANGRRLGQVATPVDVSKYMAHCLLTQNSSSVLDPGAGEGALSLAVAEGASTRYLTLVEVDPALASRLSKNPKFSGARVVVSDFIPWAIQQIKSGHSWDRIIANPPYLNFHDFDRDTISAVNRALGTKLNKLSNLFSVFILLSSRLLAPGGRMVFVTPTELFTTNYGKRTLGSLARGVHLAGVVVFDPDAEPFSEVDTSACITIFEQSGGTTATEVEVQRVTERNGETGLWQVSAARMVSQSRLLAHPKDVIWKEEHSGGIPVNLLVPLRKPHGCPSGRLGNGRLST